MSLIHGLTLGSLFGFQTFNRSLIVEDVTRSHKLVRNLALQDVVRRLKDKRQGDIVLRIYISCARSTSAWIHYRWAERDPMALNARRVARVKNDGSK